MKRKVLAVLIAAALAGPAAVYAQSTAPQKDTGTTPNTGMTPPKDGTAKDRPAGTTAPKDSGMTKGSATTSTTTKGDASVKSDTSTKSSTTAKNKDGSPDAVITGKIKTGFIKDKIVRSRNYNVDTRDGVVTVKGKARTQAELDRALEIAKNTQGVKSVNSEVQLMASADAPKREGTASSSSTRSGSTASATTPRDPSAKADAKKAGDMSASTSTGAKGTAAGGSASASASKEGSTKEGGSSDAMITTKIKAEHAKDKDVSATRINVDTSNGVVTLSGTAKSKAEADKAVALAKNVKGVTSVKNNIKVEAAK